MISFFPDCEKYDFCNFHRFGRGSGLPFPVLNTKLIRSLALTILFPPFLSVSSEEERVRSLESVQEVRRDGTILLEYRFSVQANGDAIKRGPCLNFLTVYRGPGNLVLKKRISEIELFRNGEAEPFRESIGEGTHQIFCGEESVLLNPGVHEYDFRCVIDGDWKVAGGEAIGSFDVSGPFQGLPVDSARLILRFPGEIRASKFAPSVYGNTGPSPGYEVRQGGAELLVSTTSPLVKNHSFEVRAIWPAAGFASQSRWSEVLRQHPKIPITMVTALALLWILGILTVRLVKSAGRRSVKTGNPATQTP